MSTSKNNKKTATHSTSTSVSPAQEAIIHLIKNEVIKFRRLHNKDLASVKEVSQGEMVSMDRLQGVKCRSCDDAILGKCTTAVLLLRNKNRANPDPMEFEAEEGHDKEFWFHKDCFSCSCIIPADPDNVDKPERACGRKKITINVPGGQSFVHMANHLPVCHNHVGDEALSIPCFDPMTERKKARAFERKWGFVRLRSKQTPESCHENAERVVDAICTMHAADSEPAKEILKTERGHSLKDYEPKEDEDEEDAVAMDIDKNDWAAHMSWPLGEFGFFGVLRQAEPTEDLPVSIQRQMKNSMLATPMMSREAFAIRSKTTDALDLLIPFNVNKNGEKTKEKRNLQTTFGPYVVLPGHQTLPCQGQLRCFSTEKRNKKKEPKEEGGSQRSSDLLVLNGFTFLTDTSAKKGGLSIIACPKKFDVRDTSKTPPEMTPTDFLKFLEELDSRAPNFGVYDRGHPLEGFTSRLRANAGDVIIFKDARPWKLESGNSTVVGMMVGGSDMWAKKETLFARSNMAIGGYVEIRNHGRVGWKVMADVPNQVPRDSPSSFPGIFQPVGDLAVFAREIYGTHKSGVKKTPTEFLSPSRGGFAVVDTGDMQDSDDEHEHEEKTPVARTKKPAAVKTKKRSNMDEADNERDNEADSKKPAVVKKKMSTVAHDEDSPVGKANKQFDVQKKATKDVERRIEGKAIPKPVAKKAREEEEKNEDNSNGEKAVVIVKKKKTVTTEDGEKKEPVKQTVAVLMKKKAQQEKSEDEKKSVAVVKKKETKADEEEKKKPVVAKKKETKAEEEEEEEKPVVAKKKKQQPPPSPKEEEEEEEEEEKPVQVKKKRSRPSKAKKRPPTAIVPYLPATEIDDDAEEFPMRSELKMNPEFFGNQTDEDLLAGVEDHIIKSTHIVRKSSTLEKWKVSANEALMRSVSFTVRGNVEITLFDASMACGITPYQLEKLTEDVNTHLANPRSGKNVFGGNATFSFVRKVYGENLHYGKTHQECEDKMPSYISDMMNGLNAVIDRMENDDIPKLNQCVWVAGNKKRDHFPPTKRTDLLPHGLMFLLTFGSTQPILRILTLESEKKSSSIGASLVDLAFVTGMGIMFSEEFADNDHGVVFDRFIQANSPANGEEGCEMDPFVTLAFYACDPVKKSPKHATGGRKYVMSQSSKAAAAKKSKAKKNAKKSKGPAGPTKTPGKSADDVRKEFVEICKDEEINKKTKTDPELKQMSLAIGRCMKSIKENPTDKTLIGRLHELAGKFFKELTGEEWDNGVRDIAQDENGDDDDDDDMVVNLPPSPKVGKKKKAAPPKKAAKQVEEEEDDDDDVKGGFGDDRDPDALFHIPKKTSQLVLEGGKVVKRSTRAKKAVSDDKRAAAQEAMRELDMKAYKSSEAARKRKLEKAGKKFVPIKFSVWQKRAVKGEEYTGGGGGGSGAYADDDDDSLVDYSSDESSDEGDILEVGIELNEEEEALYNLHSDQMEEDGTIPAKVHNRWGRMYDSFTNAPNADKLKKLQEDLNALKLALGYEVNDEEEDDDDEGEEAEEQPKSKKSSSQSTLDLTGATIVQAGWNADMDQETTSEFVNVAMETMMAFVDASYSFKRVNTQEGLAVMTPFQTMIEKLCDRGVVTRFDTKSMKRFIAQSRGVVELLHSISGNDQEQEEVLEANEDEEDDVADEGEEPGDDDENEREEEDDEDEEEEENEQEEQEDEEDEDEPETKKTKVSASAPDAVLEEMLSPLRSKDGKKRVKPSEEKPASPKKTKVEIVEEEDEDDDDDDDDEDENIVLEPMQEDDEDEDDEDHDTVSSQSEDAAKEEEEDEQQQAVPVQEEEDEEEAHVSGSEEMATKDKGVVVDQNNEEAIVQSPKPLDKKRVKQDEEEEDSDVVDAQTPSKKPTGTNGILSSSSAPAKSPVPIAAITGGHILCVGETMEQVRELASEHVDPDEMDEYIDFKDLPGNWKAALMKMNPPREPVIASLCGLGETIFWK